MKHSFWYNESMKTKNRTLQRVLCTTILLVMAMISGCQPANIDNLAEINDYEAFVDEKQMLAINVDPKEYDEEAVYSIVFEDDGYMTNTEMNYNEGVLYSETSIVLDLSGSEVRFLVEKGNSKAEIKLFKIVSISHTYIETEDLFR